jgi:hypothetical protein
MGCASNDADQRESPDAYRTQGAGLPGCRNGEISVWERIGKAEGLRAEVKISSRSTKETIFQFHGANAERSSEFRNLSGDTQLGIHCGHTPSAVNRARRDTLPSGPFGRKSIRPGHFAIPLIAAVYSAAGPRAASVRYLPADAVPSP